MKNKKIKDIIISKKIIMNNIIYYKLLIVGDCNVGKTTFIKRHDKKIFEENYIQGTHAKLYSLIFCINTYPKIYVDVWDLPGQEIRTDINSAILSEINCAIIMYDKTNLSTYLNVSIWYKKIYNKRCEIPIIIVGTKNDLRDKIISMPIYLNNGIEHFNISTKNNNNIERPIIWLAKEIKKYFSYNKIMNQKYYKLIVIGACKVGKTSFIKKHYEGTFEEHYNQDIRTKIYPFTIRTNVSIINFSIWDIPGTEILIDTHDELLCSTNCVIIMFDRTDLDSYNSALHWYKKIYNIDHNIFVAIVGTKNDLDNKIVNMDDYLNRNLIHFNISSKDNYNIDEPLLWLARQLENCPDLIFLK